MIQWLYCQLSICVKLNFIADYIEYAEGLPERVRASFRSKPTCGFCREGVCRNRRMRVFEGESYAECGYLWNITFASYEPEDLEYYKKIITYELDSRLKRKNKS